jgi:hypothetical protein
MEACMLRLKRICLVHFAVAVLLSCVQMFFQKMTFHLGLLFLFNAVCLAERFWEVQRRSMGLWSVATQLCFLLSRAIVTFVMATTAGVFLALLHQG